MLKETAQVALTTHITSRARKIIALGQNPLIVTMTTSHIMWCFARLTTEYQ